MNFICSLNKFIPPIHSLVESEHPVPEGCPPRSNHCHAPESSVVFVRPSQHVLMGTIAEGSVGRHLAVAQLVISTFVHVEGHGSASCQHPLALAVAERVHLGHAAAAPVVSLASVEVDMGGVDTCVGWHAWRSVPAFLVWP